MGSKADPVRSAALQCTADPSRVEGGNRGNSLREYLQILRYAPCRAARGGDGVEERASSKRQPLQESSPALPRPGRAGVRGAAGSTNRAAHASATAVGPTGPHRAPPEGRTGRGAAGKGVWRHGTARHCTAGRGGTGFGPDMGPEDDDEGLARLDRCRLSPLKGIGGILLEGRETPGR